MSVLSCARQKLLMAGLKVINRRVRMYINRRNTELARRREDVRMRVVFNTK